jgi:alpha-beta hydrolase superfamily lysophospholipase
VGDIETVARWFGPAERPLLGWLTARRDGGLGSGVVIAPPIGYEHLTSHRTLRVLAETLAAAGHRVLRFDYDGTGDSSGDAWDPGRVSAWRESLRAAADELRAQGCAGVTLVGLRLGAMLALAEGAEVGADAVVAWAPVASGKRYAKELRLLGTEIPAEHDRGCGAAFAQAGDAYTGPTLADLAALEGPARCPAPRVLLVDDRPAKLAAVLEALGADVSTTTAEGSATMLQTTAERAEVPQARIEDVRAWIGAADGPPLPPVAAAAEASVAVAAGGPTLRETVVRLGPHGLVGVLTEPLVVDPDAATVVLLNSGSEPHFGPGRAWVAFARGLAAAGHRALRFDFRGWGESPDDGKAPGRPYEDHCTDDLRAVVEALTERGHRHVVPFGLCSGAYIALKMAVDHPVGGVIALNPQMYWAHGQPRLLTPDENAAYRTDERARLSRGARRGLWTALDLLGHRDVAGRWLADLARSTTPIALVYAEGDEGLFHLRTRLSRRLARSLGSKNMALVEIPDIDHSMHRLWRRAAIFEALEEQARAMAASGRPARARDRGLAPA